MCAPSLIQEDPILRVNHEHVALEVVVCLESLHTPLACSRLLRLPL